MLKSCVGALEAYLWRTLNVYNHIDRIICCSDFLKKNMDRDPLFASKTVTIHNFVDQVPDINSEKKTMFCILEDFLKKKESILLLKLAESYLILILFLQEAVLLKKR